MTDPVLLLAFGFGSGLAKKAPGTFGTIAGIAVYYVLIQTPPWFYVMFTIIGALAGIRICELASRKLNEHDFNGIVWDEIIGYLMTLWLVPFSWQNIIAGFLVFRLFDIAKPWPISWLDRHIGGGLGIMLDDMLAGLFSFLTMHGLLALDWL
jgi:phosphatidylglycerophosphatase A